MNLRIYAKFRWLSGKGSARFQRAAPFGILPKYVFSVATSCPISLTPRFSEVYGGVRYHNRFSGFLLHSQKTAQAVGVRSGAGNTQLKQGVNERGIDAKHLLAE
ncbi:MAG: hypothetical protein DME32_05845 [Verrucomicrobia bacterium]|nr:MAG: hypothetical protein DME32_05845 [Verrucomicrobiota bacterium]